MNETTLRISFVLEDGKNGILSFKYADPSASAAIGTLVNTILTNKAVYANPPQSANWAELVTTTTTPVAID